MLHSFVHRNIDIIFLFPDYLGDRDWLIISHKVY
jgi:hypothetical protein